MTFPPPDNAKHLIESDFEERRRKFIVNSFLLVGAPTLLFFAIQDLLSDRYFTAALLFGGACTILGLGFLIRMKEASIVQSRLYGGFLVVSVLIIAFLLIYVIGVEHAPSRFFYAFTFPMIVFFVFSTRAGVIWTLSFFVILILALNYPTPLAGNTPITAEELTHRFYRGFPLVCAIVFFLKHVLLKERSLLIEGQMALRESREQAREALSDLGREMSERKQIEAALVASESRYRLMAENIQDVIWTMGMDFQFTYVSPVAAKMQGWSPREFLALKANDIMTRKSFEKVAAVFTEKHSLGEATGDFNRSATLELELLHKNGTRVPAEVTAAFALGEDNRPVGMLGVTRDITDRVRAQKEKEELLDRLNRMKKMEALGMLAGGVAHDLNNVLSGIVSYPDLLLLDLEPDSPFRTSIESIRESGKKAAAIVQDLLSLARRGVIVSEVVNLNDIVDEYLKSSAYERLRSFHPRVELETRLDPILSNIMGSPTNLFQCLMNLVSNAAEAMPEGGQITIITANTHFQQPVKAYTEVKAGDYAELGVLDSGEGISREDMNRIFEPFYSKKKMGRSGTGLGMAVVWGTVQDLGGAIDLRSAAGKGTDIRLYFPATGKLMDKVADRTPAAAYHGNGESILIIDDVQEQREVGTKILDQLGYTVDSAASGEDAVARLQENRFDLLILDMIMEPGIDGLETYRRILAINPNQKAIITSGYAETSRVKEAKRLGVGGYLRKPYSVDELGRAIKRELGRKDSIN